MSRFTPNDLLLTVSQTTVTLSPLARRQGVDAAPLHSVELEPGEGTHAVSASLSTLAPHHLPRGAKLTIVLADPLVRLFVVTPPDNATKFEDLKGATSLRFSTLYGTPPGDWRIAAAWSVRAPFLACAAPTALIDALIQFASARKLRLQRIAPATSYSWRCSGHLPTASPNWLLTKQGTVVTLLVCNQNKAQLVRSMRWPETTWLSVEQLRAAISLEAMRLDLKPPSVVYGAGDIPPKLVADDDSKLALRRLDAPASTFAWRRRIPMLDLDLRPGPAVRAKISFGIVAFSAVLLTCIGALATQSIYLARQRFALTAEADRVRGQVAARLGSGDANRATPIKSEQVASVNNAIRQLNLPWSQLLRDIAASTPKEIALLSLEPDANRSSLKGTAEAPDATGMLNYVTQLKTLGHFESVLLTRHELNEQDPMRPLRFQFEAHWGEAPK